MSRQRVAAALVATIVIASCNSDATSDPTTTTSAPTSSTAAPTSTTTSPTTTSVASSTTTSPTTSTTLTPEPTPPVLWPAAGATFGTPEEAASDFLQRVFGDGPVLGEFMQGDARSGEFEVFATADEGVAIGTARATLVMRQFGPDDGWFVLAAVSGLNSITTPTSGDVVAPGALTVEGEAVGFEATIVVEAFVVGAELTEIDQVVTMAGNFDEPMPFSVQVDLGAARSGDVVVVLVRGGTGLETDPGDFAAVAVLIE